MYKKPRRGTRSAPIGALPSFLLLQLPMPDEEKAQRCRLHAGNEIRGQRARNSYQTGSLFSSGRRRVALLLIKTIMAVWTVVVLGASGGRGGEVGGGGKGSIAT